MKKLFIIGNGFDIDHNLSTQYSKFKEYLEDNYLDDSCECISTPWSKTMPDGEERFNIVEVVKFLLKVITNSEASGDNWAHLEETLGYLDFDDCFDDLFDDDDDDDDEWKKVYKNEDIASNIYGAVSLIKDLFSDWVKTIDYLNAKPKKAFSELIDCDIDLFLTFNYTETLERIYQPKNVYHIHGKQGGELVFGHGNDQNYRAEHYLGAENYLYDLQSALRKDTNSIISRYKNLFKVLGEVDEIYSYGFSFSRVDMVYIKELCAASNTEHIVWYINNFDKKKSEDIKKKIVDCGFKGRFEFFSV